MAADQLEKASTSAICGARLGGHVTGNELFNPKFDPCWKKAEELGCLVFVHTQGIPGMNQRLAGNGGADQCHRQPA